MIRMLLTFIYFSFSLPVVAESMGAALNVASTLNAYALTDRGTWIIFGNKGPLTLLVSGDPQMFNPYGVLLVNPAGTLM